MPTPPTRRACLHTSAAATASLLVASPGSADAPEAEKTVRVVVWDEQQREQKDVYENFLRNWIARPMKGQAFVLDTVLAMLEWASDPDRGNLLPDGFRNPFLRHGETRPLFRGDPLSEPDITLPMALDLMRTCDCYQLRLFAPMLLFGLRAAEPCYLFREYLEDDWLGVPCNLDLAYQTKGRRDKRFPPAGRIEAVVGGPPRRRQQRPALPAAGGPRRP